MQHFDNNIINLSKEKNRDIFLFCLVKSIINLTNSPVYKGRILIGGLYHKKYYSIIKKAFKNEKTQYFIDKTNNLSQFIFNLSENMCNFGMFLFKNKKDICIKIYCGNKFLIDKNLQNNIEKFIENYNVDFENEFIEENDNEFKFINYYENLFKNEKFCFNICCENLGLNNQIKRFNFSNISKITIKIFNDFTYKIFINNAEISKEIFFRNFIKMKEDDDENIIKLNLKKLKNVVNKEYLLYTKSSNYFDIFVTLKYLNKKLKKYVWKRYKYEDSTKLV